jgi:hypothetical protein
MKHQEHVGAPLPDPLDGRQLGDDLLVRELVQTLELELAAQDVLGQRAQEADLGAREPGRRTELLGVVIEDLLRRRGPV